MPKEKTHEIKVKVRFDKPVTKTQARRMFADTVHGEFYPYEGDGAETMRIVSPKIGRK